MNASQIIFETMTQDHLGEAVALSAQAGWPHRREDWALVLALSNGVVALEDGRVVGTAMTTLFGGDTATINMVIVDESMRGRGLGRKLMQTALEAADKRICLLIATQEGLPLYEKLGFVATGEIVQHQGVVSGVDAPDNVSWATPEDFDHLFVLDRLAAGHDRFELMQLLVERAQFAVVRTDGAVNAFAAIRVFGRGFVIGPVIASNDTEARALIGFLLSQHIGEFVRVDTHISTNLAEWLAQRGLVHVGGGIPMRRAANMQQENKIPSPYRIYALVNQALG
ncbi:N-acetyltransferase [Phyllobacterium brassicacearum]|uniref:N-acetyltransferase n=1 Tax=Phyllobacterium brassicacearum TaxID=314235 RepID=A0A2P7BEM7_9HYPH|nr:GNAT family N-acetyltransferase [Phyllobacterium brassicacearum]PSH64944.1 N-acetyltransferase [Phyllobacterium brassicacearum]TDQ22942.1 acetyltransferase (GNAT) family protein [Phyllobacterium brassicacearum]